MSDDRSAVRERLLHLFDVDFKDHGARWDSLWVNGDLPFDRGAPNPALLDTITDKHDFFRPIASKYASGNVTRKRALVPGCGRGYDVLLLASFGYDAYGLEISSKAVESCKDFAKNNAVTYTSKVEKDAVGHYDYLLGDFFNDKWRDSADKMGGFDVIYDYTFLSALPPEARPAWSIRMSKLLKPDGKLICLEFPTYKEPESGGPPFALPPEVYLAHLSRPGERLPYDKGLPRNGCCDTIAEDGLKRIAHWKPERTHDIGKGTDWVSIWEHDKSSVQM